MFFFWIVWSDVSPSACRYRWDLQGRWRGCLHVFPTLRYECTNDVMLLNVNQQRHWILIASENFTFLWLTVSLGIALYCFVWWLTGWYHCCWCLHTSRSRTTTNTSIHGWKSAKYWKKWSFHTKLSNREQSHKLNDTSGFDFIQAVIKNTHESSRVLIFP